LRKKAAFVSEGRSRGLNSIYLPGVMGAGTTPLDFRLDIPDLRF
jgi:hypothetical protein